MSDYTTDQIDGIDTALWYERLPRLWFWNIGDEEAPIDAGHARTREAALAQMLDAIHDHTIAA